MPQDRCHSQRAHLKDILADVSCTAGIQVDFCQRHSSCSDLHILCRLVHSFFRATAVSESLTSDYCIAQYIYHWVLCIMYTTVLSLKCLRKHSLGELTISVSQQAWSSQKSGAWFQCGKEKTTSFGVNLLRSPVVYRAAQGGLVSVYAWRRALTVVCSRRWHCFCRLNPVQSEWVGTQQKSRGGSPELQSRPLDTPQKRCQWS